MVAISIRIVATDARRDQVSRKGKFPPRCLQSSGHGRIMPRMSNEAFSHVGPCYRCGQPAERMTIGDDIVVSERVEQLPLCAACADLMLTDFEAFWKTLRERWE